MSIPQCTLKGDSVSFNCQKNVKLSNLYESSAEHAFQCLQYVEGSYEDWCVGGKFADWDYVLGIMKEHNYSYGSFWRKKKLIGTLAVYVVNHPLTFGLKLKPEDEKTAASIERWFPIFRAKYKGDLKKTLLKTSGLLVQLDPKAMRIPWKWGGKVHNGVLYGENLIGYMLTAFRDTIRHKRPREVMEVGHMSTLEVVDAKFKKAKVEGNIVDLS